jgi:hypothetical protein
MRRTISIAHMYLTSASCCTAFVSLHCFATSIFLPQQSLLLIRRSLHFRMYVSRRRRRRSRLTRCVADASARRRRMRNWFCKDTLRILFCAFLFLGHVWQKLTIRSYHTCSSLLVCRHKLMARYKTNNAAESKPDATGRPTRTRRHYLRWYNRHF